jgi:DHA1 family bicyclomycin/chloramphenicol resistance-like MFS transporter
VTIGTAEAEAPAPDPVMPGELFSRRQRLQLVLVLGSLIAIGPLTIDMYLPALPAITDDLLTTDTAVQLTLTGTLVGLALGQLLIGPLSDAIGRRRPLLGGLIVHIVASVLCVVAPNIAVLGGLRILQGLGVAATTVVAMAVVRDLFSGVAFAALLSRLLLVMGTAPILAPTLGSAVLGWTQWRGVFVALAGFGVALTVLAAFCLRETLPAARRQPARVGTTLRGYGSLLRDRTFVGLSLVAGLAMGALFSYVSGSSFVLQEEHGLTEQQFGVAFGAGAVGLITATQLNVRLLRRYTPQQLLTTGLAMGAVAGLALVGFAATGLGGLAGILIPLWLVLAGAGLVLPNAPAVAMSRHGEAAGTAAAVLGSLQFGLGAVLAPLVGVLGGDALAMAFVIAGTMLLASVALRFIARGAQLGGADPAPAAAVAH